jgi:myo-inositol 2-dehydrogenase/D-chiro-inositol 1-dehydrogenase
MFRDMTIHDFDMARFIMGEEPVSVLPRAAIWLTRRLVRRAISTPRLLS